LSTVFLSVFLALSSLNRFGFSPEFPLPIQVVSSFLLKQSRPEDPCRPRTKEQNFGTGQASSKAKHFEIAPLGMTVHRFTCDRTQGG